MANIQANIKRHDQDIKKHIQIHSQISAMKSQVKKTQKTKSKKDLSIAYKMIDSALSKGIIKKNKADRLKSRLALFVNDEKRSVSIETKKVYKKTDSKKSKVEKTIDAKPITKTEEKIDAHKVEVKPEITATVTKSKTQKPKTAKTQSNASKGSEDHHATTKKIVLKTNKSSNNAKTTTTPNTSAKTKSVKKVK